MTALTNPITEAREALHYMANNGPYLPSRVMKITAALDYAETQAAEIERWKSAAAEWQETCENSQKYAQAIIAELKAENQRLKDSEQYTAGDYDEKQTQIDNLKAKLAKAEEVIDAAVAFRDAKQGTVELSFTWSALQAAMERYASQFTKGEEG